MNCPVCSKSIIQPSTGRKRKTCSDACRKQLNRDVTKDIDPKPQAFRDNGSETLISPLNGYSEANIRVLSEEDIYLNPQYDWVLVDELARRFNKAKAWVKRGVEACRHSGVSPEYFIERHIHKKQIEKNPEVDRVFRELNFG